MTVSIKGFKYHERTCRQCNAILSFVDSDVIVSQHITYRKWWWNKCEMMGVIICPNCTNSVVVFKVRC